MTQHGRHSKARPRHYWLGAGTAAVLLLAVVASSRWWTADGGAPTATAAAEQANGTPAAASQAAPSETTREATGEATPPDDPQALVATAVASCRAMHAAQAPPLRSAKRSIEQWRVHVDAMNQLVAGEITLDQAYGFWEQTRVGAQDRIDRFDADDAAYRGSGSRCPWVTEELRPGDVPRLAQCRQATAARQELLTAARVAVGTWSHHVHDMERLREGTLSPEQATELWLQSWRQGVEQLDTYAAKARDAGATSC